MPKKRIHIPEHIKLKLWILAGGRCEFPRCNKYLWRDGLTLKEDNFAELAHVIAQSPDGPRGRYCISSALSTDFNNLMLLCSTHHKLIDGKNKEDFPIEVLQSYKKRHEERIYSQTNVQDDLMTVVVRFMANIRDRRTDISLDQAHLAILPRWSHGGGILFDYTSKSGDGNTSFWKAFFNDVDKDVLRKLSEDNTRQRFEHLSIFALGPIPLLMRFGNQLGNIISADLYQMHRDTKNWKWKEEIKADRFSYLVNRPKSKMKAGKIALILSLSGKIHLSEISKYFSDKSLVYEITIAQPNVEFLLRKSQLEKFRKVYRDLITEIRTLHGDKVEIHIFPAIPAPVAVLCGKELLPKSDPKVFVYDNNKDKGGFIQPLKIN